MNPFPVWRTEFAVLKLYLRRLPKQLPWLLAGTAAFDLLFLGSAELLKIALAHTRLSWKFSLTSLGVAICVLIFTAIASTIMGVLWRQTDKGVLKSSNPSFPIISLMRAGVFTLGILAGTAVITYAALKVLPWHLHTLGLSNGRAQEITVAVLVLLYLPLFLRLFLLAPLVALDNQRTLVGWKLALKTLSGKTVPLFAAVAFQALLCLPFVAIYVLVLPHALSASAATNVNTYLQAVLTHSQLPTTMAAISLVGCALGVSAAMQAAMVRHFFGHPTSEASLTPLAVTPNYAQAPTYLPSLRQTSDFYFDESILGNDEGEITATLPPIYQPQTSPPMHAHSETEKTVLPPKAAPIPETAPPMRTRATTPTAAAAAATARPQKTPKNTPPTAVPRSAPQKEKETEWAFVLEEADAEADPFSSFDVNAEDKPTEEDPFARLR